MNIIEYIQPYLEDIIKNVVGILALIVLSSFALLRTKIKVWIDTKTSANQRELLHKIANEAFAYAETVYNSEPSRNKLSQAFIYASNRLGKLGIKVTEEEINAAIEKAVLEYNAQKKKAS